MARTASRPRYRACSSVVVAAAVNRRGVFTPRIASRRDGTGAALPRSLVDCEFHRVRLSDPGCCVRRGNELLHRLSAERLQEPLHDRVLPVVEGVWIDGGKAAEDGERGELRLGREPVFDRCQIWIEL